MSRGPRPRASHSRLGTSIRFSSAPTQHKRRKPRAGGHNGPRTGAWRGDEPRYGLEIRKCCAGLQREARDLRISTVNGTLQRGSGRKGGCARYKTEKRAPAAAKVANGSLRVFTASGGIPLLLARQDLAHRRLAAQ